MPISTRLGAFIKNGGYVNPITFSYATQNLTRYDIYIPLSVETAVGSWVVGVDGVEVPQQIQKVVDHVWWEEWLRAQLYTVQSYVSLLI